MESSEVRDQAQEGRGAALGFISVYKLDARTYRGGILVTDDRGRPLEFRASTPLRPDGVQTILYGNSLFPAITQDLCGLVLVQSIKDRPQVVLADHWAFLQLHSDGLPVVWVRAGDTLEVEGREFEGEEDFISSDKFESVVVQFAPGVTPAVRETVHRTLEAASGQVSLLEPFARVATAITVLSKQEAGKSE